MWRAIIIGAVVGLVGALSLLPTGFVSANDRSDDSSVHVHREDKKKSKKDSSNDDEKLATVVGDDGTVIVGGKGAGAASDDASDAFGDSQGSGRYVALGDSVAAGLGLTQADDSDPDCGVSTQAYGVQVASSVNLPFTNLACSGATAGDLVTEQHLPNTSRDIEPQLDRAFAGGIPKLITITAGANDIYWPYFIRKCYTSTCGTATDKALAKALVTAMRLKLDFALDTIERRSDDGKTPQVVVTGYYKPFSKNCSTGSQGVSSKEISWLNSQTDSLNTYISKAVSKHPKFARYAPVSFSGHELCSDKPWIQGLDDAAPFHPTEEGQAKIAQAVLRKIKKDNL